MPHALPGSPCGMTRAPIQTLPDTLLRSALRLFVVQQASGSVTAAVSMPRRPGCTVTAFQPVEHGSGTLLPLTGHEMASSALSLRKIAQIADLKLDKLFHHFFGLFDGFDFFLAKMEQLRSGSTMRQK